MAFSLSGAMSGLGGAMEQAGRDMLQASLQEQRDRRLMEVQQAFARESQGRSFEHAERMQGSSQEFQRGENAASRAHAETLQGRGFEHAEGMQGRQQEFQRGENAASRALQQQLAEMQERGASARHGASMSIQRAQLQATLDQVQLLPQSDGTFMRVKKDGTTVGLLTGPDGEPVRGPKDVGAAAQLLVKGNNTIIEGLEKAAAQAATPQEKADLMARIEQKQQENKRLLGVSSGGEAKPEPSSGDIEGLKKRASNPAAVQAFESRYGQGSAARYLQPAEKPEPMGAPKGHPQSHKDVDPGEEEGPASIMGGRIRRSLEGWNDAIWGR